MASVVSIRTGSADSFYPSASGASPRQTSEAKCKRLERLHDLYQTSFSRETLLSEQYSKELLQMREQLREVLSSGQAGTHAVKGRDEGAKRTQARETKRIETMETKLSGLEVYNGQLISAINNLRMLNAPNRQAISKLAADRQKLAEGVTRHKNNTAKSLDERERFIDQLRKGRDESAYEKANFMEQLRHLKQVSDALDATSRQSMQTLEAATEQAKRQQYVELRSSRVHKEKLEVRYGYLRSQLEGIDRDFRELERIVAVRFVPSQPESLQQIIGKFLEKEAKVASLQKFWGMQNEDVERLGAETARLTAAADKAQLRDAQLAQAAAEHAAAVEARRREEEMEQRAKEAALIRNFEGACKSVGGLVAVSRCELEPALLTKGCSASTIAGFLSCLDQQLDEVEQLCVGLRDLNAEQERRERVLMHAEAQLPEEEEEELGEQRRPTAVVLHEFLARRSQALVPPQFSGLQGGEENPLDALKYTLPAVNDRDGHDEGDGEAQEHARASPARRKGAVDRETRDKQICDYARKKREIRESVLAARPSIRSFYTDEESRRAQQKSEAFSSFPTSRRYCPSATTR